jgi:hypothetical protein
VNTSTANEAWDLITFIEAVTGELDRARNLSRVKSEAGQPATYLVTQIALNLHVFPEYDGRQVTFRTAAPGEEGASELKLDLGSATTPVVEQTTKPPPRAGEVQVEDLPIDQQTRDSLKKIGVESKRDVERLRDVKVRTPAGDVDFARLADLMDQVGSGARKRPKIQDVLSFGTPGNGHKLRIVGEHLDDVMPDRVYLDGRAVQASVSPEQVDVELPYVSGGPQTTGELVLETVEGDRFRLLLESEDER